MNRQAKANLQMVDAGNLFQTIWKHRHWWMLPLGVLILLLVAIYALTHLSKTDSEMYSTSSSIRATVPHLG
jgi:hypothetical protein